MAAPACICQCQTAPCSARADGRRRSVFRPSRPEGAQRAPAGRLRAPLAAAELSSGPSRTRSRKNCSSPAAEAAAADRGAEPDPSRRDLANLPPQKSRSDGCHQAYAMVWKQGKKQANAARPTGVVVARPCPAARPKSALSSPLRRPALQKNGHPNPGSTGTRFQAPPKLPKTGGRSQLHRQIFAHHHLDRCRAPISPAPAPHATS